MCIGDSILLNTFDSAYTNYLWSDGYAQPQRTVFAAGIFVVNATSSFCSNTAQVNVHTYQLPTPSIVQFDTACLELSDTIRLYCPYKGKMYQWSTGDTVALIQVNKTGIYQLTVKDSNLCTASTQIEPVSDCLPFMHVPTAFSPNGDGLNDEFIIVCSPLTFFDLKIFSPWGEMVFDSENPKKGWNGTFKDVPCQPGSYAWVLIAQQNSPTGRRIYKRGIITLVR